MEIYASENNYTNCLTDIKDTSNKVEIVACLIK